MNALQLAKKYRVRLNYVYQVFYDLEAKGLIEPDRKRSRLNLNERDSIILEKELQRREYRRLAKGA
jgi:DNA-binding transcriptional regulator YhcF (GntR family)